jgi:hypothetical protein
MGTIQAIGTQTMFSSWDIGFGRFDLNIRRREILAGLRRLELSSGKSAQCLTPPGGRIALPCAATTGE